MASPHYSGYPLCKRTAEIAWNSPDLESDVSRFPLTGMVFHPQSQIHPKYYLSRSIPVNGTEQPFSSARRILKSKSIASFGKKNCVMPVSHIRALWSPDQAISSFGHGLHPELLMLTLNTDVLPSNAVWQGVWC